MLLTNSRIECVNFIVYNDKIKTLCLTLKNNTNKGKMHIINSKKY